MSGTVAVKAVVYRYPGHLCVLVMVYRLKGLSSQLTEEEGSPSRVMASPVRLSLQAVQMVSRVFYTEVVF